MESVSTTKTEEKGKSQFTSTGLPKAGPLFESEAGAPAGLPIFLQRSALSFVGSDVTQLKCDECAHPEAEAETQKSAFQFKLVIGAPNDPYEREADRVAEAVNAHEIDQQPTTMDHLSDERVQKCSACAPSQPCSECAAKSSTPSHETFVQAKPQSPAPTSSALPSAIGTTNSGSPVPRAIREKVEPVLGIDLSHVQVHTDAAAQSSAKHLEAKAFTHQNHIWLGPHQSANDVTLMAHELAHVVQQTGADAPAETIQRQPEQPTGEDGEAVRLRLQQHIDEELGGRSPSVQQSNAATAPATAADATPAPATADPNTRQAMPEVDRAELRERTAELEPDAQPDVNRAQEQQPQVEEAARSTAEGLDRPPEPLAGAAAPAQQPDAGASQNGGGRDGEQVGRAMAQQAENVANEAFSAADSGPMPDTPEILVPPEEVQPVDAGGLPLPGNPAVDEQAIELANDAQNLREQGQLLREYSAEERTNAQILRGNIGLVNQGIGNSESGVQTAQGHTTFRRGLLEQARQALSVSEQKAANVAAQAPGGVAQANENKSRSGPMASEARDMTSRNNANTPEDPEAAARAREQGGQLNRASSDATTIDDTLTQVHGTANTLVEDAAHATQINTQSVGRISAIEATLGRTEERVVEMQGQNVEARGQLDSLSDQPGEISSQAAELDVEGQDLVQASRDIEARLHGTQQSYAEGMRSVPAAAPSREEDEPAMAETPQGVEASAPEARAVEAEPVDASAPAEASVNASEPVQAGASATEAPAEEAASSDEVLVQRTPEDGAAATPAPSNFDLATSLGMRSHSWLTGEPNPDERERQQRQREQDERRQHEIDEINNELHGRRFEQLSAGERRSIALRLSARNLFGGLSNISWPTLGGIAHGAARLATGLIDPRAPMMGVITGLNMIVNSTVNFAREPSWTGALRLAANIATGLTIIFGSITALAAVVAALMTALIIVTLGGAAIFAGPIIAFCASVMSIVGGWTFVVGLVAAGLQALVFLVDLYRAGTMQTAEALQQHSERMTEDAANAGNSLFQAAMGRLMQAGGRSLQSRITKAGGGIRYGARIGAGVRTLPSRAIGAARSFGVGGLASRAGTSLMAGGRYLASLPGRAWKSITGGARNVWTLPGRAAGAVRGGLQTMRTAGFRGVLGRVGPGLSTSVRNALRGITGQFKPDYIFGKGIRSLAKARRETSEILGAASLINPVLRNPAALQAMTSAEIAQFLQRVNTAGIRPAFLIPVGGGRLTVVTGSQVFSESEIFSARYMAQRGNNVVLRPPSGTRAAGNTSDLIVNGRLYDVYTPTSSNPTRVLEGIQKKNSQLSSGGGVVVDLRASPLSSGDFPDIVPRLQGSGRTNISDVVFIK
jgi:hypothetical protein